MKTRKVQHTPFLSTCRNVCSFCNENENVYSPQAIYSVSVYTPICFNMIYITDCLKMLQLLLLNVQNMRITRMFCKICRLIYIILNIFYVFYKEHELMVVYIIYLFVLCLYFNALCLLS